MLNFSCALPHDSFIKQNTQKIFLGCYLSAVLYTTATPEVQNLLVQQLSPKKLLKNFAYEYTTHLSATFFHELGHALAAKYFFNNPITIHLGSSQPTEQKALFSLSYKSNTVTIDSYNPTVGYTKNLDFFKKIVFQYISRYAQEHNLDLHELLTNKPALAQALQNFKLPDNFQEKQAIIMLAGGTLGILSHIIVKTVLNKISKPNNSYAQALKKALQPDSIVMQNLYTMLIPSRSDQDKQNTSDGSKLWHCLKISPSIITTTENYADLLEFLSWVPLAINNGPGDTQTHTKILATLLNELCLQGYLNVKL